MYFRLLLLRPHEVPRRVQSEVERGMSQAWTPAICSPPPRSITKGPDLSCGPSRVGDAGDDRDPHVVAERGIDGAVHAEFDDAPVARMPRTSRAGPAEDLLHRVDGGLPEVEPVATNANRERDLQADRPFRQRGRPRSWSKICCL